MRLGAQDAHFAPIFAPSPPPSVATTAPAGGGKMLASVFMALLLPCLGMSVVFVIYLCLLWYSTRRRQRHAQPQPPFPEPVKPVNCKGLSVSELEKLPKLTGEELATVGRSTECAVCLDDIESGQPARLVPGCNHGFHQYCADTWLTDHTVCPVCRAELAPKLSQSENDSPC